GLSIARQFLVQGARVLVSGVHADETDVARATLAAEVGSAEESARVAGLAGDLLQPEFSKSLVAYAERTFGRLAIIVCNAGIDIIKPAVDYEPDDWDRIIDINFRGAFLLAQAAARRWIAARQGHGVVLMTSSIAGRVGVP